MKKKLISLLAATALAAAALIPTAGVASAATAATVAPLASTSCSQTVTPATVYFNVNGSAFGMCYNGTTYFSGPGNTTVVKIRAGAQKAVATFAGVGNVTIPANTTTNFNNLTITKLVVG